MDAVVLALDTRPGARPSDRLAGLPLALRAVLTAAALGAARVWLVLPERAEQEGLVLARDRRARRLALEVACLGPDVPAACRALAARVGADAGAVPLLVVDAAHLHDPASLRALAPSQRGDTLGAAATRDGLACGALAARDGARLLGALGASPGPDLRAAARALAARGELTPVDVAAGWCADAGTPDGRREATRRLFEACRKPVDGLVSRHLNRHLSLALSRRLVALPVTPNQLSIATFCLCLPAAWLAAEGGYGPTLAAAALMQLNSVCDGVDGELARVRFEASRVGAWLDTVLDDLSNLVFYAALGLGARQLPGGDLLAVSAWVAVGAGVLTAAQYYRELAVLGSGDLYALGWQLPAGTDLGARLVRAAALVLKQDFFLLLFLLLALAGVLSYALPLVATGALVTLAAATARGLRRRRALSAGGSSPR
ncbi:MAG: CDP-alcohol phosphatidyltransferase family protein [Polyangiaceae bacterium]|nr:CDP-alcohol phosphatidyltransferase family protein [Polyangiaceae bacterium]